MLMPARRQRAEHRPGHAGVRPHADAQHEQHRDVARRRPPGSRRRSRGTTSCVRFSARVRSACGTVNDSSALPGPVRFCTIMSTRMPPVATALNTVEQLPGWSGRSKIVIAALLRVQVDAADEHVLHAVEPGDGGLAVLRAGDDQRVRPRLEPVAALVRRHAGPLARLAPARTPRGPPAAPCGRGTAFLLFEVRLLDRLARSASSLGSPVRAAASSSTSTLILMSPVVIIFMLTPLGREGLEHPLGDAGDASACRRRRPTPCSPCPLSLERRPEFGDDRARASSCVFSSSALSTVKPMVALPPLPTLWAIMSTAMFAAASAAKTRWLTPGRSGTPSSTSRASSAARAAPQTGTSRHPLRLGHDPGARPRRTARCGPSAARRTSWRTRSSASA